jgi:N-acetylglucosamine-6-phosphate deacetylase
MKVTFPGLVDLQVNGFAGVDFNTPGVTPEQFARAGAAMRASGVTRCLPTLITSSYERFAACAKALLAWRDPLNAGLHMEGPYISPLDGPRGAHPAAHVCAASVDDFRRRQEAAGGRISLVTIAPEAPGVIALIEHLAKTGICVAIGHTGATAAQIQDAVRAGATMSTHLGNGCGQTLHRHNNVIWPQLAADELSASFIVDGHHLPADTVKSMLRAKTLARSVLVTDAVAAAAAPPGRYWIGELEIEAHANGRVGQPGAPNLAGSSLTMDAAVANTVRMCGLRLEEVLPLATTQAARLVGLQPAGEVTAEWDAATCALQVISIRE